MTVRILTVDDFDQIYNMYISHDTFQGLPRIASIYNEAEWNKRWYDFHLATFEDPRYIWFGDDVNGVIHSYIQYETWIKNGETVVSNGWHITNKNVPLTKSYGQEKWSDTVIHVCNHAVDYFESFNINTCYATIRGTNAKQHLWIPIASIPECRLYNYTSELVEEIPAGELPADPDILKYVTKIRKTISQSVFKLTKPNSLS